MKNKLKGAETGHSLLKRKSEALTKYALFSTPPYRPYADDMTFADASVRSLAE